MRWALLVCWCAILGCGSSAPYDYVPVSGKVIYEDGTALPGGVRLQFVAQDAPAVEGAVPRPASAILNEQGEFDVVTSYKYGDGLIPGTHKVAISGASATNGKPLVPRAYTSIATTPLVVDTADAPLEITVPKAK